MNYRVLAVVLGAGWMTGCMMGPNYHRPDVQVPQTFRAPESAAGASSRISRGPEVVGGF